MKKLSLALVVCFFTLSLLACGGGSTSTSRLGKAGESCQKASDCESGLHCFESICATVNSDGDDVEVAETEEAEKSSEVDGDKIDEQDIPVADGDEVEENSETETEIESEESSENYCFESKECFLRFGNEYQCDSIDMTCRKIGDCVDRQSCPMGDNYSCLDGKCIYSPNCANEQDCRNGQSNFHCNSALGRCLDEGLCETDRWCYNIYDSPRPYCGPTGLCQEFQYCEVNSDCYRFGTRYNSRCQGDTCVDLGNCSDTYTCNLYYPDAGFVCDETGACVPPETDGDTDDETESETDDRYGDPCYAINFQDCISTTTFHPCDNTVWKYNLSVTLTCPEGTVCDEGGCITTADGDSDETEAESEAESDSDSDVEFEMDTEVFDCSASTSTSLIASPNSVTFGRVAIGSKNMRIVQLCNYSTETVSISVLRFMQNTSVDFSKKNAPSPLDLASGKGINIYIIYYPTDTVADSGNLQIVSSDLVSPSLLVPLSGGTL